MAQPMKWLRLSLQAIGALSLLLFLAAAALIVHGLASGENITPTRKDVLFVLNWSGISTDQDFKVLAGYRSSRSLTGDHFDFYCIQLSRFEVAEFAKTQWHDGPETNPLLVDALELGANEARRHSDCFPSPREANSAAMKMMFCSVTLHDREPNGAEIILYDLGKKRLYYVGYKN